MASGAIKVIFSSLSLKMIADAIAKRPPRLNPIIEKCRIISFSRNVSRV